jgi:diaminobutyrate-2-oxoglutarate transaminase
MAVNLIKPEFDIWNPGEFSGTFRGNNLAFATATAMLDTFWTSDELSRAVTENGRRVASVLADVRDADPVSIVSTEGRGLMHGLRFTTVEAADEVANYAFERGLIVETCGTDGATVKILPPLTIIRDELDRGLEILSEAVKAASGSFRRRAR